MASNPPGKCCTVGVKHEGKATGEMKMVGDVETYFAYPASKDPTNAILILTDVIGHAFLNAQLIADQFAANGYLVAMPDLFAHDAVPLNYSSTGFSLPAWLRHHDVAATEPIVTALITYLRSDAVGVKNLGAVGYCFGAKYVVRALAPQPGGGDQQKKIQAAYVAHPSFVDAEELARIAAPLSIAAAETDEIFTVEKRHESEKILAGVGQPYRLVLYSGVAHGFAVRGDPSKPDARAAKEEAFLQAVNWFDRFVKRA
ncbi:MAG: hypothetical protein M1819_001017 [Sarea resinae]|nr:MAG: hypothetical protein M1819_001017 [Sarea resinae]